MDYLKRRFVVGPKSSDQADRYAEGYERTFRGTEVSEDGRYMRVYAKCGRCQEHIDPFWVHVPAPDAPGCVVVREDLVGE